MPHRFHPYFFHGSNYVKILQNVNSIYPQSELWIWRDLLAASYGDTRVTPSSFETPDEQGISSGKPRLQGVLKNETPLARVIPCHLQWPPQARMASLCWRIAILWKPSANNCPADSQPNSKKLISKASSQEPAFFSQAPSTSLVELAWWDLGKVGQPIPSLIGKS